jgi:hypothetical protein
MPRSSNFALELRTSAIAQYHLLPSAAHLENHAAAAEQAVAATAAWL